MISNHKKTAPLSQRIGTVFLVIGIGLLVGSYFLTSQILVFMGLGLAFWGALFLLITPVLYVEGNLMVSTLASTYAGAERIIKDLDCKGKGFHIPPYPNQDYVPEHLKGLREMVVFIPKDSETAKPPSLQELVEGKFLLHNPEGIVLTPPGLGLLTSIEKKLKLDFTKTTVADVCQIMPKYILGDYSLAKEINMTANENKLNLKITGSIYKSFFTEKNNALSVSLLGCPIMSSIACALAKSSGKPVSIQKIKSSPNGSIIDAEFEILQGS